MVRAVLVSIVLVCGIAFTAWLGHAAAPYEFVRGDDEAALALAPERALAVEHGLATVIAEAVATDPSVHDELLLDAGECVAVIAIDERYGPVRLALAVNGAVTTREDSLVHLAACAEDASTAEVSIDRPATQFPTSATLHYVLLRGRVVAPRTYPRLVLSGGQRAALDAENVRARLEPEVPAPTRLGAEHVASRERAVLLPATRASFAALRALAGRADLAPACDASTPDPFATPTDERTPPRVFTPAGQERLLAVVDAGALGASCVRVVFARLDDPTSATVVRRVSVPDQSVITVASTDPALAIDDVCPATGLFAYTTDATEGAELAVFAAGLAADAPSPAAPSHFGDAVLGRHPSSGLTIPPVALVASSRAECVAGSADACLTLAALARDRIDGAGTVREALEPGCSAVGGLACDVLAGAIASGAGEHDAREADGLERRACMTGVPDACMRRGARFLAGADDLDAAYRTFRYGCDHGCADCCTAAITMRDWELAPAAAPDDPSEPG